MYLRSFENNYAVVDGVLWCLLCSLPPRHYVVSIEYLAYLCLIPPPAPLTRLAFPRQFEADRRAIIITINSFGTELSKDDRSKLYPRCGKLNPDGIAALARADDYEQVKAVAEYYGVSITIPGCGRMGPED